MENTNLNDAAALILENEREALIDLHVAYTAFDEALAAIQTTLPASLSMDALRIVQEARGQISYRLMQELPNLISMRTPSDVVTPVVVPVE